MPPEGTPPTILLMRHGETEWNRRRRIMGDLDVPLSDEGRQQCAQAASLLAGWPIHRIVTSPLARAAESAVIVASRLAVDVTTDERLVEVRFGCWQGKTYEEVSLDPRYLAFCEDPVANETPGGETAHIVQQRGLESVATARPGECVLFVTHGDIIRTMLCHFLGAPLAQYRRIRTDNCGLSAVEIRRAAPEVKFVNVLADPERARSHTHWSGRP
ncbi:MAG TPA: histidine phosphatase family protein [Candidatus Binatia bacterium]|jgi:broad specificity phosphatase PhoE